MCCRLVGSSRAAGREMHLQPGRCIRAFADFNYAVNCSSGNAVFPLTEGERERRTERGDGMCSERQRKLGLGGKVTSAEREGGKKKIKGQN